MSTGKIVQISVNPKGGVPKNRIAQTTLGLNGVVGDKQRYTKIHGGPERAVCLFSYELIRELQDEGHPIDCGTAGENLTLSGIDWSQVAPGDLFHIGDPKNPAVVLRVTRYTTPCKTIQESFIDHDFMRISHQTHPGWSRIYTRVLKEGIVNEGDAVGFRKAES